MKYFLLFGILLSLSCLINNPVIIDDLTVDDILDINATNENFINHLDGTWKGYYQTINTKTDTLFLKDNEVMEERLFPNPKYDSLRIREIKVSQDTSNKPLQFTFNTPTLLSDSNSVTIKTNSMIQEYHFTSNSSLFEAPGKRTISLKTELNETPHTWIINGDSVLGYSTHGYYYPNCILTDSLIRTNLRFHIDFPEHDSLILTNASHTLEIRLLKE